MPDRSYRIAFLALGVAAAASLVPAAAPAGVGGPGGPLAIDDFEDGDLDAASGLSWVVLADDLLGGQSSGEVGTVAGGAGGRRALRFHGRLAEGFPAPFAGAWVPVSPGALPRDLSCYGGLRFRARGGGATFLAGARRGDGNQSANYMRSFVAPAAWTEVVIPFAELTQTFPPKPEIAWSYQDVGWIGFTTSPGGLGEFTLEVDEIEIYPAAADAPSLTALPKTVKLRLTPAAETAGFPWRQLAAEPEPDGKSPRLPDARALSYHHDRATGFAWFKIDLSRPLGPAWFGLNLAVDDDGDPDNGGAWWGPSNGEFHYDRLVTAWLSKAGADYQGVVGVADAGGVAAGSFNNVARDGLRVSLAEGGRALVLGLPRSLLGDRPAPRLIATVGSAFIPNDDLPNRAAVTLPED